MIYKGSKVEAHTGSTKNGTYKLVVGTVLDFVTRDITPTHYVVEVVIIDADGVQYVTGKSRVREIETEEIPAMPETPETAEANVCTAKCPHCDRGLKVTANGVHIGHVYPMYRRNRFGFRKSLACPGGRPAAAWDTFRGTEAEALHSAIYGLSTCR